VNDSRKNLEVLQQHGKLPLCNWGAAAAKLAPFGNWIAGELLYELFRCDGLTIRNYLAHGGEQSTALARLGLLL